MHLLSRAASAAIAFARVAIWRAPGGRCDTQAWGSGAKVSVLPTGSLFQSHADGLPANPTGGGMRPPSAGAKRPGGLRRGLASPARPSVLVIDDQVASDTGLGTLVQLLGLDGFDVECVETADEGLRRTLTGAYDAIVLDLRLPDRPGLEVLEAIRAHGSDIPVLVLTGWYLDEGHQSKARALGVHHYLYKPVYADELAPLLWQAIGGMPGVAPGLGGAGRQAASDALPALAAGPVARDVEDEAAPYGSGADELALKHLLRLRRVLRAKFLRAPDDSVMEAIHDAFLDYLAGPGRHDPLPEDRVQSYLSIAARRNLMDILRAEKRRRHRENVYAVAASQVASLDTAFRESSGLRRRIRALVSNPAEERALFLWAEDAPLEQLAAALGCSALPAAEQRTEVKRLIDRIRRRARRRRLPRY